MAATRTLTAAEREGLWSRLADVRDAGLDDYRRLDSRLHSAVAEAAGSPSLVPLVAENRMRLNALLDQIPLLARNIAHSNEQHEAIVIAILAGDAEAAGSAMCSHVGGSAALLHGFLDQIRTMNAGADQGAQATTALTDVDTAGYAALRPAVRSASPGDPAQPAPHPVSA